MKKILMLIALLSVLLFGARTLSAVSYPPEQPEPIAAPMAAKPARAAHKASAPLLVNADYPLPDDYQPQALINLYEQKDRAFQLASSDICVDKQVFEAMNRMFKEAKREGTDGFIISSGYRSRARQQQIYDDSPAGIAALPGSSEHESGLAFDVTAYGNPNFEDTPQFDWLRERCWAFGFIIRYPDGKQHITGIDYEPWHYRYVGVEVAQALRDSGETLEEYLEAS